MNTGGGSMFDEFAIFDVKLILRDPADIVNYRAIHNKLKEIDFVATINTALQNALSSHDLLLKVKPETKETK